MGLVVCSVGGVPGHGERITALVDVVVVPIRSCPLLLLSSFFPTFFHRRSLRCLPAVSINHCPILVAACGLHPGPDMDHASDWNG